jgi:hypothetical protein
MIQVSNAFSCVPPLGWEEKRRGPSLVFRRPERELVISFWAIKEGLNAEKRPVAVEALMKTAFKGIKKESKNPNLQSSVPLTRVDENDLEFWVQSLVTRDGTVLICSAVVRGATGVLLATMESPTDPDHFPIFVEFLRSVKTLPEALQV